MGSEKLIVKVDLADFRADREYRALCIAREGGLPVPEIVFWNSGLPSVLIYRPVSGLSLVQVDTEAAWNDAGRHLRRIHELPAQGVGPFDWKGNGWADFARLWLAQSLQWLAQSGLMADLEIERLTNIGWAGIEGAEERPRRFLHGDCQPLHYLVDAATNEISGIIDFGDAGTGDPLWDIATICVNRARRPWLLAGYGDVDAGPESLGALLDSYYVLRHISAVGWLIENELDAKPSVDLLRQIIANR